MKEKILVVVASGAILALLAWTGERLLASYNMERDNELQWEVLRSLNSMHLTKEGE